MWELNAERQGLLRVMAATRISPVNRHRPALRVAIGLVLKKSPAMGWATAQNDAPGTETTISAAARRRRDAGHMPVGLCPKKMSAAGAHCAQLLWVSDKHVGC